MIFGKDYAIVSPQELEWVKHWSIFKKEEKPKIDISKIVRKFNERKNS